MAASGQTPHGEPDPGGSLGIAILTVSDSRTVAEDRSGDLIRDLADEAGHRMVRRGLVADQPEAIRGWVADAIQDDRVEAIVLTGGTGISPRDQTVDTVAKMLDRTLEGFGELFRMLSFEEIGPRAQLSRALAGVAHGTPIYCLPGSTAAVRLGMQRLILPVLPHVVGELRR
ncbi:MAG: MogA/MoaB family molybdenum cofactor biosynthesis protein [Acidobacteriota bacterium]|nr:MogA/MoaB family molybdenum cofactor biosynthesis protein [Acidobacteriota bacterium]